MIKKEIDELFSLINMWGVTTQNYPTYLEETFQIAISEKRRANYDNSLSIINNMLRNERRVYTGILNGAFKTIAASGYLKEAIDILEICNREMQRICYENNFTDHLRRINYALYSEESLVQYLKTISGNPYYTLPRSFNAIISDIY